MFFMVNKQFSRIFPTISMKLRQLQKAKVHMTTSVCANKENQEIGELTRTTVDPQTKIATLTLNRLPANALSVDLLRAIKESINELEKQNVRGVILTSASDRIFCAGLDLFEVYKRDRDHLIELWTALQNMWKVIYGTKLPTAALINGHALAGGCVLAICCDYRVILPNLTIGLNETRAGIVVPQYVMDTYVNVVRSRRIAEADMIGSHCYKSHEALNVGLVDELVETKDEGFKKCKEFLRSFEGPTRNAAAKTKFDFRSEVLRDFEGNRKHDLDIFLSGAQRQEFQDFLGSYLKSLRDKKSSK